MMLRMSTAADKYFRFSIRCHGYKDIHDTHKFQDIVWDVN